MRYVVNKWSGVVYIMGVICIDPNNNGDDNGVCVMGPRYGARVMGSEQRALGIAMETVQCICARSPQWSTRNGVRARSPQWSMLNDNCNGVLTM